jgi:hypothetical protein
MGVTGKTIAAEIQSFEKTKIQLINVAFQSSVGFQCLMLTEFYSLVQSEND